MKKQIRCLSWIVVFLLIPALALAGVRMPADRGTVTDDANVLSAQTASDIAEYARLLKDDTGINVRVAIVHFLDGLDAQTYAARLFEKWKLDSGDLLVLAAAGEDVCASAMGADAADRLGRSNAENLLYTSSDFASLLRAQQYDAAFNAYFTALNTLVEKQTGEAIRLGKLFGAQSVPAHTVNDFGSELWNDVMEALENSGVAYEEHLKRHDQEENGLTAGGWIMLFILFGILRRSSRKKGRKRRGCSPLGWLIGLLGLGFLFDRD